MTSAIPSAERVKLQVRAPDVDTAERVMAEAWAAGALGIEERSDEGGVVMIVYLAADRVAGCRAALDAAFASEAVRCEAAVAVVDEDWSETWKAGIEAVVVSERLVVRPSFVRHAARPGQREILIEPGQAFGTGGHASTRLALEWIDALATADAAILHGARVLDVGTGSGVLALAAVALGAAGAVGLDLDRDAVREAARGASQNGLAERVAFFVGGVEALGAPCFPLVVANLLRTEMLPIAAGLAAAVAPGGALVLSGLLAADGPAVRSAFEALGLRAAGERRMSDPSGETWIAPRFDRLAR